jgi:ATP-dependent RNA helicase SUPV3L1/SUV3
VPDGLASRLAVRADAVPAALRALGVRLAPGAVLAADQYGPPSPPMMLPGRRREHPAARAPSPAPPRVADGPFAALVAFRR